VLRERVDVQLQDSALPDRLEVREALELYGSFYGDPADPDKLRAELGLSDKADARFASLSGDSSSGCRSRSHLSATRRSRSSTSSPPGWTHRRVATPWALIESVRDGGVTIVLVTHVIEEAERLCDRLALIDHGRVVTIDTPAGVVGRAMPEQRFWFRPSAPVDDAIISGLPDVTQGQPRFDLSAWAEAGSRVVKIVVMNPPRAVVQQSTRRSSRSVDRSDVDGARYVCSGRTAHPDRAVSALVDLRTAGATDPGALAGGVRRARASGREQPLRDRRLEAAGDRILLETAQPIAENCPQLEGAFRAGRVGAYDSNVEPLT
jgi:hypothetical protein